MSAEMDALAKALADLQEQGCSDHGCAFGHPGGMGTNGGCKCLNYQLSITTRSRLARVLYVARQVVHAPHQPQQESGHVRQ